MCYARIVKPIYIFHILKCVSVPLLLFLIRIHFALSLSLSLPLLLLLSHLQHAYVYVRASMCMYLSMWWLNVVVSMHWIFCTKRCRFSALKHWITLLAWTDFILVNWKLTRLILGQSRISSFFFILENFYLPLLYPYPKKERVQNANLLCCRLVFRFPFVRCFIRSFSDYLLPFFI